MSADVVLTLLGTGDAFGSGGRLQTCFHVRTPDGAFLIDCGASSCIAMKRNGVDLHTIDAVFISHFHADHFAGVPFLLIESRMRKRSRPLTIAGPPQIEERVNSAMSVLFPGAGMAGHFPVRYVEYQSGVTVDAGVARVTARPVTHAPDTSPHSLRIEAANRIISYSGDTEWNDALLDTARGADVFLCELSSFDGPGGIHLDYATLLLHRPALECRRLVITHMGDDVLANTDRVATGLNATIAHDGLTLNV